MTMIRWESFPGNALECSGLPWFDENLADLWRLPRRSSLPDGVRVQACPCRCKVPYALRYIRTQLVYIEHCGDS